MNQKRNYVLFAVMFVIVMLLSIAGYNSYIQRQVYYESTQNLLSTYSQASKTFNMFAQRNWNILEIWGNDLVELAQEKNVESKWRNYVNAKANWQYSEVVLFNEDEQFWAVGGRQGDAPHMKAALEELYAANRPIVTSYISSKGVRKVMFAVQLEPTEMDGIVYTSLAICYDNTALETMLGGMAYEGQSDCYIVRSNGDVVLSTEPKTELTERLANLFDYLQENAVLEKAYFDEMLARIPEQGVGSVKYVFQGKSYYLVYQPVGVEDWSIIGIVPTDVVDGGMRRVQMTTLSLLSVLALIILTGAAKIIYDAAKRAEAEKQELQRREELVEQMFQGMARIVKRYAVCDLDADQYEHFERVQEKLYPEKGTYHDLLDKASHKYVVMTDGVDVKMTQILAPDHLRKVLKKPDDMFTFEYAARDKSSFLMMNVVPSGWKDGHLTQVMLITQDMGRQHVLKQLANTDGLTGLLNKRYFDTLLAALVNRKQSFALFYLDLDRFKPVNDTYGHNMGDKLLSQVAERLQGCIRITDYAFRLGGDEFALLVLGDLSESVCSGKVDAIRSAVAAPYSIDGTTLQIGTSCGFALCPQEGADAAMLCGLADQRMYENKQKNHALHDAAPEGMTIS